MTTPARWALPAGAESDPAFARLHDYWLRKTRKSLDGGARLPSRADIDPLEIPRELLPDIGLLEVERQGPDSPWGARRYRIRLFGSALESMTGANETGRYYDETVEPAGYAVLARLLGTVIDERRPLYFAAPSAAAGRGFLWFGRLALPLAGDGEQVDMILGLVRPLPHPPSVPPAPKPG